MSCPGSPAASPLKALLDTELGKFGVVAQALVREPCAVPATPQLRIDCGGRDAKRGGNVFGAQACLNHLLDFLPLLIRAESVVCQCVHLLTGIKKLSYTTNLLVCNSIIGAAEEYPVAKTQSSGRKPAKPEYSAEKILTNQMYAAVALYKKDMTLQAIAEELSLNPIKVRKLLITAGVYQSDIADAVQQTFQSFRTTQDYKTAVSSTMAVLQLSRASVTSYLPYEKGVYFPKEAPVEKISVGAERQRRYRAVRKLRTEPTEEHLWEVVLLYSGVRFKTYSGLPFTYEIRKGRNGQYTKELWIDRRENSKSLAWSSVLLALNNIKEVGAVVDRPKALGDIRGVTYIYGMFYRFGLIDMPDKVNGKMKRAGRQM
jgi:hypothetical protein